VSLRERIHEDIKIAMKAREPARVAALRLLLAAVKQREVDERIVLTDALVIAVIEKMQKQRRESIAQYTAAGRGDLADAEQFELDVFAAYMPQAMASEEIDRIIDVAIEQSGASTAADMGKVIGLVKPQVVGRADMALVSQRIKSRLSVHSTPR
jgi:uncharacterized protein YqeY